MVAPYNRPEVGSDSISEVPLRQPPAPWTTRLRIGFDVAIERKSPWVSAKGWAVVFAVIVNVIAVSAILFGVALSLVIAAVMGLASLMILLSGSIIDRMMYRMHKRAARPDEIAALRIYCRPGTWPIVRNAADDWLRNCPKLPITIAMILRWESDATGRILATMPPTPAEQAAAQAQALAFE